MPLQMPEPNQVDPRLSGISEPVRLKRVGGFSRNASRFSLPLQIRQGWRDGLSLVVATALEPGQWGGWRAVIELASVPSGFV